jgi:hypothetical protein
MLLQTLGRFLTGLGLASTAATAALLTWGPTQFNAIELLRFTPYPLMLAPVLLAWLLSWTVGWVGPKAAASCCE